MKSVIMILMLAASAAAQETAPTIDLANPLADARIGVAWSAQGQQLGVAYVPVIYIVGATTRREYATINLGASNEMRSGETGYLFSFGARIDTLFAKMGESKFAQRYLRFAVLPPMQISPTLLTSDFKKFTWYLTVATKFGGK